MESTAISRRKQRRISNLQRRKLIELMSRHPELKKPPNHSYGQSMWQQIAAECNAVPGSKKSWRMWRKTWQDMSSKAKLRKAQRMGVPPSDVTLSVQKDIADPITGAPITEQKPEFVNIDLDQNNIKLESYNNDDKSESYNNDDYDDDYSNTSLSEPESPKPKVKKSQRLKNKLSKIKNDKKSKKHKDSISSLSEQLIADNLKRKLDMQEDYYETKKNYLKQKLKLLKECTNALKTIASALTDLDDGQLTSNKE